MIQFDEKSLLWDAVEYFGKIQQNCINLFALLYWFGNVIKSNEELGITPSASPKAMLDSLLGADTLTS